MKTIGKDHFQGCNELVNDMVAVDMDQICSAWSLMIYEFSFLVLNMSFCTVVLTCLSVFLSH